MIRLLSAAAFVTSLSERYVPRNTIVAGFPMQAEIDMPDRFAASLGQCAAGERSSAIKSS
jgi:hypothetical protein